MSDDVKNLHDALMSGSSHRANILNPNVTVVCIGIERGDYNGWDAVMVTQNFARTSPALHIDNGSGSVGCGGSGHDKIFGGRNSDRLNGDAGNDTILGGSGAVTLSGGSGNDRLVGGTGSDRIDGQNGNDILVGNSGNDVFVFSSGDAVIQDFNEHSGREDIDLRSASGINGYSDLRSNHMSQRGDNILIEDNSGNSLLVMNALMSDLDAGDFLFYRMRLVCVFCGPDVLANLHSRRSNGQSGGLEHSAQCKA